MNDSAAETSYISESWDAYWRGAKEGAAFSSGGSSHPLVLSFWSHYFSHIRDDWDGSPSIIDIASGSGAVADCARTVFNGELPPFTCLDVSEPAIRMLEERIPGVQGVVADAADNRLETAGYDIVTSQYGIEYAGLDAVNDVSRLVAPQGELALLIHHRGGAIYAQCEASLKAIEKVQTSNFVVKCRNMFAAGFAALKGGNRDDYTAAGKAFAPAVSAMESIMREFGNDVADSTILRLYRDVREIHANMQRYDAEDVLAWLDQMRDELVSYHGRMESMCNVAIDENQFENVQARVADDGFEILRADILAQSDRELPLAWILVAKKNVTS